MTASGPTPARALARGALFALLLGAALLAPAAARAAAVSVVRSLNDVAPDREPATSFGGEAGFAADNPAGGPPTAHLEAARNEFESFQIAVGAGAASLDGVDLQLSSPLRAGDGATIPAGDVRIYREAYYGVVRPSDGELGLGDPCQASCRVPDALIPEKDVFFEERRDAFPVDVPAGENRVAWVDVLVPIDQEPGDYTGTVTVSAEGATLAEVGVSLRVLDTPPLPSTSSLGGAIGATPNRLCAAHASATRDPCDDGETSFWKLAGLYGQAALENRLTLTNPFVEAPTGANLAPFRQYVEPLLDGTSAARLPGAEMTDVLLNAFQASDIGAWKEEGAHAGFLDRISFFCDELNSQRASWETYCDTPYQEAAANWNATSPAAGSLPLLLVGGLRSYEYGLANFPATAGAADTLVPVAGRIGGEGEPSGIQIQRRGLASERPSYDPFLEADPAHRLWTYVDCDSDGCGDGPSPSSEFSGWPSYAIDVPPSESRALPWLDYLYELNGDYYYEAFGRLPQAWNECTAGEPADGGCQYDNGVNGDGTLFYPGTPERIGGSTDIPIESMRLKRMRDGREDWEYMAMATAAGEGAEVRSIVTGLFPNAWSTARSQDRLDAAREQLAALLTAAPPGGPEAGGGAALPAAPFLPAAPLPSHPAPRTILRSAHLRHTIRTSRHRATLRFSFGADGPASFSCRLDRARFTACRSPHQVTAGPGRHRFEVRATDPAGVVDPTPPRSPSRSSA